MACIDDSDERFRAKHELIDERLSAKLGD